jgi:hypothetical protein
VGIDGVGIAVGEKISELKKRFSDLQVETMQVTTHCFL